MDIIRNIFKSPLTLPRTDSIKIDNTPLNMIEEQIKLLENINLSPLPSTKEDLMLHKNEIAASLKKIISNFDTILLDKLRKNKSLSNMNSTGSGNGNKDIALGRSSSNQLEEQHYWIYLSRYFQIPSVKFINNIYDKLQTIPEKGLAWLYISISEKSFHESLREIYNQNFDRKFYENDSLIVIKKNEILSLSEKLGKFHLFNIKLGIEDDYNEYKRVKEMEKKSNDNDNIDVPIISPINNQKINENAFIITPYNLDVTKSGYNNTDNFYYSKATMDLNFQSKPDYNQSTRTIDNLFNIINNEDEETLLNQGPADEDDLELIREKSHAKNTRIIYNNVNKNGNMFNLNGLVGASDIIGEERILTTLKNLSKQQNSKENYNVSKYLDLQNCYKDDYYNFKFENNEKRDKENHKHRKESLIIYNGNDFDSGNNLKKHTYIPFDKHFRISKKNDKNQFTKKDIIYYKNKELKMTNSILFYLNNFYKKEPYIKFNNQITSSKPITVNLDYL